jgi:hypothetical protein
MSVELYLLPWADKQPRPAKVSELLTMRGYVIEGTPVVYANGTLAVEAEPDPTEAWAELWPEAEAPPANPLSDHIKTLAEARKQLEVTPEHELSESQRVTLALIVLLMAGYGVA